jgi:hypothetical protein
VFSYILLSKIMCLTSYYMYTWSAYRIVFQIYW